MDSPRLDDDITFIAKRYRTGRFNTRNAWRHLGIGPLPVWRKYPVAAAIAAAIVLTASAAIIYKTTSAPDASAPVPETHAGTCATTTAVKAIDFEDAPLPEVVEMINATYGVEVENLPESAHELRLSLHYQGTAADLVATINDILGTEMTVTPR